LRGNRYNSIDFGQTITTKQPHLCTWGGGTTDEILGENQKYQSSLHKVLHTRGEQVCISLLKDVRTKIVRGKIQKKFFLKKGSNRIKCCIFAPDFGVKSLKPLRITVKREGIRKTPYKHACYCPKFPPPHVAVMCNEIKRGMVLGRNKCHEV